MIFFRKKETKTKTHSYRLNPNDSLEIFCPKGYKYADVKVEIVAHRTKTIEETIDKKLINDND